MTPFKSANQRKAVMAKYHYQIRFPSIKPSNLYYWRYSEHLYTTPNKAKKTFEKIKEEYKSIKLYKNHKNPILKKLNVKQAKKLFYHKK